MNITSGKIQTAQKVVIYGPEGIGKSTFASRFPDPVFIDTEGSTKHMDVRRFDKPTSWAMLLDQVKYVRDTVELCKTLVLDTADWAELLCTNDVLARYKKSNIEDFGYGKGYVYISEEFGRLLNLLEEVISTGVNVVLTAHAKMRKFEQPDEMGAYDRWEMKLSKQAAPMVKEWADMVLFASYKTIVVKDGSGDNAKAKAQGGKRVMYTSHHPCWDAKNRHDLPELMDFDFAGIAHCFPSAYAMAEIAPRQSCTQIDSSARSLTVVQPDSGVQSSSGEGEFPQPPAELPQSLRDLMITHKVTEEMIRAVVSEKRYFPYDTPIVNYGAEFINGALIAGWPQLLPLLEKARSIPF